MKENEQPRKRFSKPYNFLDSKGEKDLTSLIQVFQHFHLDEFREEIHLWKNLALCNNDNAYGEGEEREDLIDFIHELQKLTEALHIINCRLQKHDKKDKQKGLSKEIKKTLSKMNRIVALSEIESENPEEVIKRFCKTFTFSYAKSELLDLLDAVVTYYGPKSVNMINVVLLYRHLHHMVKLSYNISKGKLNLKI